MAGSGSRKLILNMVYDILYRDANSDTVLAALSKPNCTLDPRDKRFVRRTVKGILEKKTVLDYCITKLSKIPLRKIRPKALCILYTGLYQLLFTDVKDHAAVSESLKLAEETGFTALKPYINAILRKAASEKEALWNGIRPNLLSGVPDFLYDRLCLWYGKEQADSILSGFSREDHVLSARRNKSLVTEEELFPALLQEGVSAVPSGYTDDTFFLSDLSSLEGLASFRKGWFYIQDMSSALDLTSVSDLFSEGKELKILDACASPGGKTLHAADLLSGRGQILACDVSEAKLLRLRENIRTSGFQNILTEVRDASEYDEALRGQFDLVIADVPCSGIGTIHKKPELRFRITEEMLQELPELQKRILDNLSSYVKPGGTLLYSTCTLNPAENEDRVRDFLGEHRDFSSVPFSSAFPEILRKNENGRGMLTLFPSEDYRGSGFFIARLRKESV